MSAPVGTTPWLTAEEAGAIARVSEKVIRRAVRSGRLKAAIVDRRGTLRINRGWLTDWLTALAEDPASPERVAVGDGDDRTPSLRIAG